MRPRALPLAAVLLAALPRAVAAAPETTLAREGWTIVADGAAGRLTVSHERLGPLLENLRLTAGPSVAAAFSAEATPAGRLVLRTTAPVGTWTLEPRRDALRATATVAGGALRADQHALGILVVDAATGKPVSLDYGLVTAHQTDAGGAVRSVTLGVDRASLPASVRAYLMVDTTPAARATLTVR